MTGEASPAPPADRWFLGTSARPRDATAMIAIKGERRTEGTAVPLNDAQKLFPTTGEVELRSHAALELKAGDWLLVRTAKNDRHRSAATFKVVGHRRLVQFADLSHLGSAEAARRLLVEDGWAGGTAADWSFRVDSDHVVRVALAATPGGVFKATGPGLEALAAWRYDCSRIVTFALADEELRLYDVAEQEQVSTFDWSDDMAYIERIVRAIHEGEASDNTPLRIGRWLRAHADAISDNSDPGVAYEILRSRALANKLSARRDVLEAYFSAVRTDPDVAVLVTTAAERAAEAEVPDMRLRLEARLAEEVEAGRAEQEAAVRGSLAQLERELYEDLERTIEAKSALAAAAIAERTRIADEAVDADLAKRRVALEHAVADLDVHLAQSSAKFSSMMERIAAGKSQIAALETEEADLKERVERALAAVASIDARLPGGDSLQVAPIFLAQGSAAVPARFRPGGAVLAAREMSDAVRNSPLLSATGRTVLLQTVALMLAGEVPVIHGAEAEDLLEVAQALLSNGRIVRFQADPTVISIEDLWTRPGTMVPTPLREALSFSASESGGAVIGVVADAERSAMRFWHPAAASVARRGDLPRALLLCCTVGRPDADEVKALGDDVCLVDAEGTIAAGASAVAALLLGPASPKLTAFHPDALPVDMAATVASVSKVGYPKRLGHARRLARICAEAIALEMEAAEIEPLLSRLLAAWEGRREAAPTIKLVTSNP